MKDVFKDACRGDDRLYKKARRSARRRIKQADRKAFAFRENR